MSMCVLLKSVACKITESIIKIELMNLFKDNVACIFFYCFRKTFPII